MKFAVTVGSYGLPEFIELQIVQLRHVFGSSLDILISDDLSEHSPEILDICNRHGVHHYCPDMPRGHFAGDCQAAVNAIAFARQQKAELAVKVSQRFLFADPVCREILDSTFQNPNFAIGVAPKIHPRSVPRMESRFFANFPMLTDMVCLRSDALEPLELRHLYEIRLQNRRSHVDTLVESLWAYVIDTKFADKTAFFPQFAYHYPGREPIFLRRCQSEPADYQKVALARGLKPFVPVLAEWRVLLPGYRPVPAFI